MKHSLSLLLAIAAAGTLHAGTPAKAPLAPVSIPEEPVFGRATIGGKFSEDLQSGYVDTVLGLSTGDAHAFFLNLRGMADDSNQEVFNAGLGFRYLLEDPGVILGANVFYDHINSSAGNNFNQLGFGAEVLSKWVDARFNYYLPEDGSKSIGSFSQETGSRTTLGPRRRSGNRIVRDVIETVETTRFNLVEVALQGWNAEVGFLVPGVEKYLELRLFAGAYGYQNPIGGDFQGFKARAEARINRYITLDLEYWDDENLVGGNLVGGFRVSHPFDLGALLTGHNPFRTGPAMTDLPSSRSLRTRMDEMVMRSHRVYTTSGQPEPGNTSTDSNVIDQETVGNVAPPTVTPPTSGGGGGGGEEQPN
jgi:hypothetical protein